MAESHSRSAKNSTTMISPSSTQSAKHKQGYILHQNSNECEQVTVISLKGRIAVKPYLPSFKWIAGPTQYMLLWGTRVRNPNGISIASAADLQVTVLSACTVRTCPSELPDYPWLIRIATHAFLGSPDSTTLTASRSVQSFSHGLRRYPTDRTAYTQTTLDL